MLTHTHTLTRVTHLRLDGAMHGRSPGLLDAAAAEGLGAGGQRRVRDPVGDFMLQCRRSLSVHHITLLHLTHTSDHSHSQPAGGGTTGGVYIHGRNY